jgi:hypothetical protein
MSEHKQLQPPDYHRCMDTVFRSPTACRELLHRLANTTESDLRAKWSPWKDQDPPPYGPKAKDQIPAEVRLLMAEAALAGERAGDQLLWRELYDLMGIPPMQESPAELIFWIRTRIERLEKRIAELEGTAADGTQGA